MPALLWLYRDDLCRLHIRLTATCNFDLLHFTGIPLLYASMMLKHREMLGDNEAMDQEEASGYPNVGHLVFLVDAYKPAFFMFEVSQSHLNQNGAMHGFDH